MKYILHLIQFLAIVATPSIDIFQWASFSENVYIVDHDMSDYITYVFVQCEYLS